MALSDRNALKFRRQIFLTAAPNLNNGQSRISAIGFRGKFARFEFDEVSAAIDTHESIFFLINRAAPFAFAKEEYRQWLVTQIADPPTCPP